MRKVVVTVLEVAAICAGLAYALLCYAIGRLMDIAERLRRIALTDLSEHITEAADEIERLRAEVAELKKANDEVNATCCKEAVERDRLRWLIDNGERVFGSLWREASAGDIDAALAKQEKDGS